ncbi:MAG: glyoxalase/bleomycin resistance/extradiol dioxygenase family protein [Clostridia bacterium]|nr:glyoxalase/bleomycin resistance/extradiol dioxygenase family protein [Clostridia bacterium]
MQVLPYFVFEGNASEAIELYEKALEGKTKYMMLYGESEDMAKKYPDFKDCIFHAEMEVGDGYVYLSDLEPGAKRTLGNNVDVHINFNFIEQLEHAYNVLKTGGTIKHPLGDTFWGARYGSVIDKFGNSWSLNCQLPQKE